MAAVSQLLASKGRRVFTTFKGATVLNAIRRMVENDVGSLVVVEGPGDGHHVRDSMADLTAKPCGIITERDYLRRVALEGRTSRSTFVQEIMTTDLVCVGLDTDLEECMRLITRRRIRHLPVLSHGLLVGLISIGDVVGYLARDRRHQIEELTAYIQGRYA